MGRGKFKGKPTGRRHFSTPEEMRECFLPPLFIHLFPVCPDLTASNSFFFVNSMDILFFSCQLMMMGEWLFSLCIFVMEFLRMKCFFYGQFNH